jgi:AbrB family looped-hinge helix DNA binding protein
MASTGEGVRLGQSGRISIPAAYRRSLGLRPGDELILQLEEDSLRIVTVPQALARGRRLVERYVSSDKDLTASLLEDRRAEAELDQRRSGRVGSAGGSA